LGPQRHAPALQTWPGLHALPQAPQWAGLLEVATQTPLHAACCDGQLARAGGAAPSSDWQPTRGVVPPKKLSAAIAASLFEKSFACIENPPTTKRAS